MNVVVYLSKMVMLVMMVGTVIVASSAVFFVMAM